LDELLGVASAPRATPADAPMADATTREAPPRAPQRFARPARESARSTLEPPLRKVLDLVEGGEAVDAIAREAGLTPGGARAALGRLELLGFVARDGFAGYARTVAEASSQAPILRQAASTDPLS
jgi:predicted Rossmann fold nucleotide-binding protein DprA/Smf involved in DNA uptake